MNNKTFNNQNQEWENKWSKINNLLPPNKFALDTYKFVKNKNLKTLLDLGCGDGKDSVFFAKKGFEVTAVDFSSKSLKLLEKRLAKENLDNLKYLEQDIANLNFKENSFDIIYANLILQYFDNQTTTKIFDDIFKILKPKGYFFVRCKSVDDFLYKKGKKIEKDMYLYKNKVRHFFSEGYLKEKLEKFDIMNIEKETSKHIMMDAKQVNSSFIKAIVKK